MVVWCFTHLPSTTTRHDSKTARNGKKLKCNEDGIKGFCVLPSTYPSAYYLAPLDTPLFGHDFHPPLQEDHEEGRLSSSWLQRSRSG